IFEHRSSYPVFNGKLRGLDIEKFRFQFLNVLTAFLQIVPNDLDGCGGLYRWRRNRLADSFKHTIGVTRITHDAAPAEEFDACLSLGALDPGDENWSDFTCHAHMSTAARGFIKTRDIDNPNITCSFRRFAQPDVRNFFRRHVANSDRPVFLHNPVRKI